MALTDRSVATLEAPERGQKMYRDGVVPGLYLRVSEGGSKSFVLVQTNRFHTLGRYGEISLVEARAAARRIRAQKTLGRVIPLSVSLETARAQYLSDIRVRPNTMQAYTRYLNRLQGTKLTDMTTEEVYRVLDTMSDSAAEIALWTYKAFFKWCCRRRYIERSPCELMQPRVKSTPRDRVLSDRELQLIWRACGPAGLSTDTQRRDKLPEHYGTIVRLLMLTGCRPREISSLQTSWLDLKERTLTIPSAIAKNHQEHTFPLGAVASVLLVQLFDGRTAEHPTFLFPALTTSSMPFDNWWDAKKQLDKILGKTVAPWQLRDLRRTYRTIHARISTPVDIAERLVNHVGASSQIQRVYDKHHYLPQMREAVQRFEAWFKENIIAVHT